MSSKKTVAAMLAAMSVLATACGGAETTPVPGATYTPYPTYTLGPNREATTLAATVTVLTGQISGAKTDAATREAKLSGDATTIALAAQPTGTTAPNTNPEVAATTSSKNSDVGGNSANKATPAPSEESTDFQFLSSNNYKNTIGTVILVVVIKYIGSSPLDRPDVVGSLLDVDGNTVATQSAFVVPSYVKPNTLMPYQISFSDPPGDAKRTSVEIQGKPVGSFNMFTADFEVVKGNLVKTKNMWGCPNYVGTVKNVGNTPASNVGVYAALYDSKDKVLDVQSGYAKISDLAPGQSSPFSVEFQNCDGYGTKVDTVTSGIISR